MRSIVSAVATEVNPARCDRTTSQFRTYGTRVHALMVTVMKLI
jgi:hypothetical protein